MRMKDRSDRSDPESRDQREAADGIAPGKRTLTGSAQQVQRATAGDRPATGATGKSMSELVPLSSDVQFADSIISGASVQRKEAGGANDTEVHAHAEHGTSGTSGALPFMDQIQRSFGGHDISGIKAHSDGAAAEGARGMGATAFATGDRVAFANAPDLHTAAHEAAHVVQQRSGVQLYGGVGEVGDRYEQNADAVADAVVRGESAEGLLGPVATASSSLPAVQRFAAMEHQALGNKGSGNATVELAPGYSLPFGDVVALAGDHFESIDQMRRFAMKERGRESRAEIEYARLWQLDHPNLGTWYDSEAREAQERRYYQLAGRNQSHFVAPSEKDRGASKAEMSGVGNDPAEIATARFRSSIPKNAPEGYRINHIRALFEAFEAARATTTGTAQANPGGGAVPTLASAMATEAFACHFLTDSFAGGHVRTARQDLKTHWDPKAPMFSYNLVGLMSDLIAHDLVNRHVYGAANRRFLASQAKGTINEELGKKSTFTLGDVVGGALHHKDNHDGLRVKAGGKAVTLYGDDQLGRPEAAETVSIGQRAVAYGVNEVRQAHTMGFVKSANAVDMIEGFMSSHGDLFAAETLVPDPTTVDTRQSPEARWHVDSIDALLQDPIFVAGATYFLNEQAEELEKIAKELGGAQGDAVEASVVKELLADPVGLLRRAVHWTPGSAIVNTWEAKRDASDYVGTASKRNALDTLTIPQRIKLVNSLVERQSPDSETPIGFDGMPEEALMKIFEESTPRDAKVIIAQVGYDRILEGLGPVQRMFFKSKYPPGEHALR